MTIEFFDSLDNSLINQANVVGNEEETYAIRTTIIHGYRTLYRLIYVRPADEKSLKLFKKAFRFVLQQSHDYPTSIDTYCYILNVAIIVAKKFKLGPKPIIAILLYELGYSKKISDLKAIKEFGPSIADLLKILLKTEAITGSGRRAESDKLRYALDKFSEDNCIAVLIKFADYLYRMHLIDQFACDEQLQIMEDVTNLYIPFAHRLGLSSVYLELQDLCLKFEHGIVYDTILKKIRTTKVAERGFLEKFAYGIAGLIQERGIKFIIKGRTKSIASISNKLRVRQVPFDLIYDLYAIRVVFETTLEQEYGDCWAIYDTITKLYEPKITNLRDWISYPKSTGYEALHIAVTTPEGQWVEIQIRAKRMDEKAEDGDAAHWKYKSNTLPDEFQDIDNKWIKHAKKFLTRLSGDKDALVSLYINKIYVQN